MRWLEMFAHRILYRGRPAIQAAFVDITARKQAEAELQEYSKRLEEMVEERTRELREAQEQLLRQEKLAVLGQLAGSVGHELRNPLSVIINAAYFLQMIQPDAEATVKEYLELIASEAYNAEKIISDLLDFARVKPTERERIAVSQLVTQVLEKQPVPEEIKVSINIPSDLPLVYVDSHQIGQVLTNLITNAYQAMPEGGHLTIEAQTVAPADVPEQLPRAPMVAIAITDTGCGIPPENMDQLFEPLFTTKPRGIGLGLTTSRNLVEANGGCIEVESQEGRGSTFTVYLPVFTNH